ncbi:hypothetical protein Xmau_03866 [Xenorhabdus mauleonii]|uniref:Uncharacterized protein n=1 Tax=Xenorhabdus mauleonii TaxID=351675 RepID=A0A1I3V6R1_9GAMM|nr:hypothetical protein [Xenorhabdus mauleonii]PHM37648.1 hypothetical protein Xmau_03866 [Xenorhabdus mauleonii]SFJ90830.1 hypothetical protein SAMN05421680_11970 [Xenorhabdus mauleonii]
MNTFNRDNDQYPIDNIITISISENVFDQICAVGDEFFWFPKVESSAGRSMIIDLEAARDIRGDFDFDLFKEIIKANTELQDYHLLTLSYFYLVTEINYLH